MPTVAVCAKSTNSRAQSAAAARCLQLYYVAHYRVAAARLCACCLMTTTAGGELCHCSFVRVDSARADALAVSEMDPHHNKKKTRTRNRPRNKCNRGDEQQQQQGHEKSHMPLLSPDPNPAISHPLPAPAAPQAMGKDSAIYLIQQLLRKKLLANKKPTATASVKVEAPPKVRTNPVAQQIAKNLDKRAQVNELLKCMGSKLQKGESAAHSFVLDN